MSKDLTPNYEKMYHMLFNAVTDALEKLDEGQCEYAKILLEKAQISVEDLYISAGDASDNELYTLKLVK